MPQIVKCPGCGKPLWIADPGSGLTTVCSSCGTGVQADESAAAPQQLASPVPSARQPVARRTNPLLIWSVLTGCLAGIAAIVVVAINRGGMRPSGRGPDVAQTASTPDAQTAPEPDAWEQRNRARILAIKTEADRLAAEGQPREALDHYRQLQQLVGDHRPASADLRRVITDAKLAQDKVVDDLLHAGPAASATAPNNSIPPTAPVTPGPIAIGPVAASPTTPNGAAAEPPASVAPSKSVTATPAPPVPSPAHPPVARQAQNAQPAEVTDEEIGHAIEHGVDWLLGKFNNGQLRDAPQEAAAKVGFNSLAVYALLQTGLANKDDRLNIKGPLMKSMLVGLKEPKIEGGPETYARALRATALSVYNRPEDKQALRADVNWLLAASHAGGYSYSSGGGRETWDNSNSQYGLLGVWAGSEAGMEIPQSYWQTVEKHWSDCQLPDGQWGYGGGGDRAGFAMDCAGTASLFITHDNLDAIRVGTSLGRPPFSKPLEKAMAWMEQGDRSVSLSSGSAPWFVGYNLYGLERVGLASGMKHLGKHDWYRELARVLVDSQQRDGSWRGVGQALHLNDLLMGGEETTFFDQCYVLLFLSRGRHPVMFSKLRYDGFWANRPRDTANLARFAGRELEKPLNWQIVGTQRGWTDWMDSPVLYIAGHQPPKFTDADVDNLRSFAQAGGLIYCNSDGSSEPFTRAVDELAKKLFPAYEMAPIPQDHPIYSMVFPMTTHPLIRAVSNGSRLLLVHTPTDPAFAWQQRAEKTRPESFQLGLNLFVYASGKSDFRNRLTTPVLPEPLTPPTHTVSYARLKYAGNWNPEPAAATQLSRYLWQKTSWALDVKQVDLAALSPGGPAIAHLTGTVAYTPTPAEIKAIQEYVEAGGVLVIDCCGGSNAFARSLETSLLPRAFPQQTPQVVDASHPLLNGKAAGYSDLGHTRIRIGHGVPPSPAGIRILSAGRGHVIYSPLDISTALLGTGTANITGFKPEYAQPLMKNIVLWTDDGQSDR